jgi:hypothetical protein
VQAAAAHPAAGRAAEKDIWADDEAADAAAAADDVDDGKELPK